MKSQWGRRKKPGIRIGTINNLQIQQRDKQVGKLNQIKIRGMEVQQYKKLIEQAITRYEKYEGKSDNLYSKARQHINLYEVELLDNLYGEREINWLDGQKRRLQAIHTEKYTIKPEHKELLGSILRIGSRVEATMDQIDKDVNQAILGASYIRLELDKQIEALDELQEENKQFESSIKRAKTGLSVIIRRAMMSKCTRFLMVLVVLAVIALIIVSVLVDRGVIVIKEAGLRALGYNS